MLYEERNGKAGPVCLSGARTRLLLAFECGQRQVSLLIGARAHHRWVGLRRRQQEPVLAACGHQTAESETERALEKMDTERERERERERE
eukprot:COSAG03_NODE_13232_length_511_cov_0.716019_1_plen_89_part_01